MAMKYFKLDISNRMLDAMETQPKVMSEISVVISWGEGVQHWIPLTFNGQSDSTVPLNVQHLHLEGKTLSCIGHLTWTEFLLQQKTGI